MDDLGDIFKAIHDILERSDDDGFTVLVETYLTSKDKSVRQTVLESLDDTLSTTSAEQRTAILAGTPLTWIPHLVPLLPDDIARATKIIHLVVTHGSPKEVILALSGALQGIEGRALGVDVGDDEDAENVELAESEELVDQLRLVIDSYTEAIPRLTITRSTPTLLSLSDAMTNIFPLIVRDCGITSSRTLLRSLCALVETLWDWVEGTTDAGGEQRAMLTQLLFTGITLLSPRIETNFAERWFLHSFPKFAGLHERNDDTEGQAGLDIAMTCATKLGVTTLNLVDRLLHPSSTSPHSSLASLNLLASSLPAINSSATSPPDLDQLTDIEDCMPILTAALSSSAIDAGLTWTWYLVHSGVPTTYDAATMILELLVPLGAMPPNPTARLLVIKLIAAIIDAVPEPPNRILLFQQLLEPANPFDLIRVQAISLLRDAISSPTSPLLIPSLLTHLSPTLYTLPTTSTPPIHLPTSVSNPDTSTPDVPPLSLPMNTLLSTMYPAWFTDTAHVLRMWIHADESNTTGVRDSAFIQKVKKEWMAPQVDRVEQLLVQIGDGGLEVKFVLERWQDALIRLQETIDSLKQ